MMEMCLRSIMLGKKLRDVPTNTSGVYCFYDLDDTAAYAGLSSDVRGRLRQHLIRQDSSVVSYGRLDIQDISRVEYWETTDTDAAEDSLIHDQRPYLNFGDGSENSAHNSPIDTGNPDGNIRLISHREQAFREEPYARSKQKLEHISRMIDKIKIAGHSTRTKRTLYEHKQILETNLAVFLGIEDPEQAELDFSSES